jgi:hypothetical protein
VPPAKHRTHGRPDLTGDGREGPARVQQLNRATTALLRLLGGSRRSHESSWGTPLRIYAYLYRTQIMSRQAASQ